MSHLLDHINSPDDLKKLSSLQLKDLASEIREKIIEVLAKNGGHLSSNLGNIELSIALHYVFDSPMDKLIWDVSHQSYTHKILTGRRERFSTLRTYGGISGFTKREENIHDIFGAGHAGTALSAAMGIVRGRDLTDEDFHVVTIIGDAGFSNGMSLEALNNIGSLKSKLIIILNDNSWSISKNLGAFASNLTTARSSILRGDFFEVFGLNYIGPIDGHNISLLIETLEEAKSVREPLVLHIVTKKGKDYPPAESDPTKFHGASPFKISTGKSIKKGNVPTYTGIFGDTLCQLAKEDERIVAITAAMSDGTGLKAFAEKFPDRFHDVGISEEHGVTFAAGLAIEGLKPVVAIYSTFLQRAYDQIVHDICLQNLAVTFAVDRAGIVGEDGPTHNGVFDFAFMRHIPNIVISAPKDENELRRLLKTALDYNGPMAIRYPRGQGEGVPLDSTLTALPVGKAEVLLEGEDIAILAIGNMVYPSIEAAKILKSCGINPTVINSRFVKPLDKGLILKIARRYKRIVTVEEHTESCGFGSAVMELLAKNGLNNIAITIMGTPDRFIEHGSVKILREKYGLNAPAIAESIRRMMGGKRSLQLRENTHERRVQERVSFQEEVNLSYENLSSFISEYSSNINENGILIKTKNPYPAGTRVKLEFRLKEGYELIDGEAEVVWVNGAANGVSDMGVKFLHLQPESQRLIKYFADTRMMRLGRGDMGYEAKTPLVLLDLVDMRSEIELIREIELPKSLWRYIDNYAKVGKRDSFLWKWVYQGVVLTSLPTIDKDMLESAYQTKVLGVMFDVMLDDVADQRQNMTMLWEILKVPYERSSISRDRLTEEECSYLDFTIALWNSINKKIKRYPRYKEFNKILVFDYLQLLNTMRYAYMINENPYLLNMSEHNLYQPHNMHMMISSTIDLMCSPEFDKKELGKLRKVIWNAQKMGRIGNMVTTWEREIWDRDFSSGIFVYAIEQGIVSVNELLNGDEEKIKEKIKASDAENHFLSQWEGCHEELRLEGERINSLDASKIINGLERLIKIHMGSKGLK